MPSPGTGSDISEQDANDLLHKLITESTKVIAAFNGAAVTAAVAGLVRLDPEGRVWITSAPHLPADCICFDPSRAVRRVYGDDRAFPGPPSGLAIKSALSFDFPDGSRMALFEMTEPV